MTRGSTELFDCARVSDYLESYLSGQVPPPERRGMRLHIHGCARCHRVVMERDPLQFFAPLADQERRPAGMDADPWDGFYDAIRAGIAADGRQTRPERRRTLIAAAAVLLAMVTVGLVAFYVVADRSRPVMTAGSAPPAPALRAPGASVPMPQTVERVRSAGEVQVYTMNYYQDEGNGASATPGAAGAHGQTAELVLIVDAGLEL